MTDPDQIFQAIQKLPVPERLRLVERVVHELADASNAEPRSRDPQAPPNLIGLFADDPEGVDAMMKTVTELRQRSKLRSPGDDNESSP